MANRKLTELPISSQPLFNSNDELYIVDINNNISKKITFTSLVGSTLSSISANNDLYNLSNNSAVEHLSGKIDTNTTNIADINTQNSSTSTNIFSATSEIFELSAKVFSNETNITNNAAAIEGFVTGSLSSTVDNLSANQDFFENSLIFGRSGMNTAPSVITDGNPDYFTFDGTFSGQAIFDESKFNTLAGVSALNLSKFNTLAGLSAIDILSGANVTSNNILATTSLGYKSGTGGTVTQSSSKTNSVTLNKTNGEIVMNGAELADDATAAFTLTNSTIGATDVVIVNVASQGTAGAYQVTVGAVAAGSCSISVLNVSGGALSEAIKLNFAVIKAVAS
jgi:hypothetical protein